MKKISIISIALISALIGYGQKKTRSVDLRGQWKFNIGDNREWSNYNYDDEKWGDLFVPSRWENEGFGGYDGFAWYRKTINFSPRDESDYHVLELGYIDDADEVYFNGVLIGKSGSMPPLYRTAYDSYRKYFIPNELIKYGKNVIAVRIYDKSHDGGLLKGQHGIYVREDLPSDIMCLNGIWKIKHEDDINFAEEQYDDYDWQDIMVPAFWKSSRDRSFTKMFFNVEEIAWYRKSFNLPGYLYEDENLVIILGRIDDFDEVYLNGYLIGSTNDGKSYGESNSYREVRRYNLPVKYLKKYDKNVIAVKVTDIGTDAGIYEGPITISNKKISDILINKFY